MHGDHSVLLIKKVCMGDVMEINELYTGVLDCAFKVHKVLGPGLLESVYLECLAYELRKLDYKVEVQKVIPIVYETIKFDKGFRADIVVNEQLVIELKAVAEMKEVHMAQLLTYMRFSGVERGLLLNFNTIRLKNGIKRAVITK